MSVTPGPLDGVRVLDLTRVVVGPFCTQLLADMGAEVIKVESLEGDLTRDIGPQRHAGMSSNFMIFNNNKKSVAVDLRSAEGGAALLKLAATCDVFVVNYRAAALEKLGIHFAAIAAANPSIVYCRIVGFGEDSPHADRPAVDDVIQAMAGIVDLQNELNGEPSFVGMPMADLTTGLYALSAILAALYRKKETGKGEEVEVRMYDCMAHFSLSPHLSGHVFSPPIGRPIYPRSVAPNRRPFATADGALCVTPYTDRQWQRFLDLIGRSDLLQDARFSTVLARANNLDALYKIMIPLVAERTNAEWERLLAEADVPYAAVQSTADLVNDPTLTAAGVLQNWRHETEGDLRLLHNPIKFSNAPGGVRHLPAHLGQHSVLALQEAGLSAEEITHLVESGVVIQSSGDFNE